MKRQNLCMLFLAGLLATQVMTAQKAVQPKDLPAPTTNFISDDDGGVVQIVPTDLSAAGPRKANAAPVMQSVQQVSVFLGSSWAEQNARSHEASLSDLTSHSHIAQLQGNNVNVLPAAPSVEDFADLSKGVNDLAIQSKLVAMLESKTLPAPDASTVFVVFLGPGVKSTVGSHTVGVHFAAYHNLVHVEAGELRYVVVPFNENASREAAAASLAIVETVFNPASN
ncbi:MAG TPA: hypothetical protein VG759_01860 [Candidatus Angelobacter sp.]|nr:hypothetical protein [Candidatus Angelobacter sp.]